MVGLPRRRSKSLLNVATSGLDDGCTSRIGARVRLVHERCTSISDAREVHEQEWCTRGVLVGGARVVEVHAMGARDYIVVHKQMAARDYVVVH